MQTRSRSIEQTETYHDFANGDLLYGLNAHRQPYLAPLRAKTGIAVTADEYNNKLFGLLTGSITEATIEITPKKARYLNRFHAKKHTIENNANDSHETKTLKTACLLNLTNSELTIRFILDGINPHDIFDADKRHYNTFTSTELRHVFRNYDQMHSHLFFYQGGRRITLGQWLKQSNALDDFRSFMEANSAETSLQALTQHQQIPAPGAIATPVSSPSRSSSSSSRTPLQTPPRFFIAVVPPSVKKTQAKRKQREDDDDYSPPASP